MITWTNFASRLGAATTTWKLDAYRGFMTNKVYADGKGPSYAYTPAGRMRTRTWARGITTTYNTNAAGDTVGMTYSDGTTSNVVYNLDRLGRRTNIVDGAGSHFLTYAASGLLLSETNASGTLAGTSITNGYDSLLRRTSLSARSNAVTLFTYSYAYDGASRLTNLSDGTYNAVYTYLANSPLVSQITFRSNTTTRMTTTKAYDNLNRLVRISSAPSASSAVSFDYGYNDANQRIRRTDSDSSYWAYEYDSLGQVTRGKHYWSDSIPVAGQQFEYAFDDIGNRLSTKAGGNEVGAALRAASYTANNLNQYTQRDVPGAADIIGIAHPNANVTVNGQSTYRKGEYYWKELSINNAAAAVWQLVTNQAVLSGTTNTATGNVFLPKTTEGYAYDLDGNLTSDGRWTNRWDAENRVLELEGLSSLPTGARKKLVFFYDQQGRRVSKTVSNWNGSAWTLASKIQILYDGWNLLAELGTNNTLIRGNMWGTDLSGSMGGAGGVGGLLAVKDSANGVQFVAFDGNGNVASLSKALDGTVSANYEYDPFGQTIRASGAMSKTNPERFSTKYADDEADLVYYGYRYYEPNTGRWLSRDPKQERAAANLNAFVENNAISRIDYLGHRSIGPPTCLCLCRCRSVSFSFNPGGAAFSFGWYPSPQVQGNMRFGSQLTVVWSVIGDPEYCRFFQDEAGSYIDIRDALDPGFTRIKTGQNGNEASCTYTDPIGVDFWSPRMNGAWEIMIVLNITLRCEGSEERPICARSVTQTISGSGSANVT
jgi:RHS repeat-associated protein